MNDFTCPLLDQCKKTKETTDMLIDTLYECITEEGAPCFVRGTESSLIRRIDAITSIARQAIARANKK